jgi:hypothetical protein
MMTTAEWRNEMLRLINGAAVSVVGERKDNRLGGEEVLLTRYREYSKEQQRTAKNSKVRRVSARVTRRGIIPSIFAGAPNKALWPTPVRPVTSLI